MRLVTTDFVLLQAISNLFNHAGDNVAVLNQLKQERKTLTAAGLHIK